MERSCQNNTRKKLGSLSLAVPVLLGPFTSSAFPSGSRSKNRTTVIRVCLACRNLGEGKSDMCMPLKGEQHVKTVILHLISTISNVCLALYDLCIDRAP